MSEAAEQRVAELEELLAGLERMMYFVLDAVDEPVYVSNERVEAGVQGDTSINIIPENDGWVFSVGEVDNEVE
jgi:hypothetical protein